MSEYFHGKPGSKEVKQIGENYEVAFFDGRPDCQSVVRVWIVTPANRFPVRDVQLASYQLFEGDYDTARQVYDRILTEGDVINRLLPSTRNPYRDPQIIRHLAVDVDEEDRKVV